MCRHAVVAGVLGSLFICAPKLMKRRGFLMAEAMKNNGSTSAFDEAMMARALELASLGSGRVSPNPMVGCVPVSYTHLTLPTIYSV